MSHTQPSPMPTYSLAYAEKGWPVFPCKKTNKQPYTKHGFKDATTEPAKICGWWEKWSDALIGVPTGDVIAAFVLDEDPLHGGKRSLAELIEKHGAVTDTLKAKTHSGGTHFNFKLPLSLDIRNSENKIGRLCRYRLSDLEAFVQAGMSAPAGVSDGGPK